jgi:hypothetical protein
MLQPLGNQMISVLGEKGMAAGVEIASPLPP